MLATVGLSLAAGRVSLDPIEAYGALNLIITISMATFWGVERSRLTWASTRKRTTADSGGRV